VPPGTELEAQVAAIWRRVLGRSDVGIDQNFFELGGHSLLLLQVKTQLQAALQREFPVVVMFQHPTVAALAKYLGSASDSKVVALSAVSARVHLRKQAIQGRRRH
jgi:acyl carrier protein